MHAEMCCDDCLAVRKQKMNDAQKKYKDKHPERVKATQKKYGQKHPEKRRRNRRNWGRRKAGVIFGLGQTEDTIIELQNFLCKCGVDLRTLPTKQVHVDHDHLITDGRPNVRGILCHGCNVALGNVQDSIPRLHALIAYLQNNLLTS